jgi:hypothetical protein
MVKIATVRTLRRDPETRLRSVAPPVATPQKPSLHKCYSVVTSRHQNLTHVRLGRITSTPSNSNSYGNVM